MVPIPVAASYVLRRLEAMPRNIVTFAVTKAVHLGAIGFDAVKLSAPTRIERRPARLGSIWRRTRTCRGWQ